MNKALIFIIGIICGIFINVITNSFTDSGDEIIRNSVQPVKTNQADASKDQSVTDKVTNKSQYIRSRNYERYWQSNGIKFKDVGENGIEKTYVWNASSKKWIDTGCVGYFEEKTD